VTECIHEFPPDLCAVCSGESYSRRAPGTGTMAGKRFALIYAPSVRDDTFLHLNREGEHWKIRWYASPHRAAVELAQSGLASTKREIDFSSVEFVHEVAYPYSTSVGGVPVTDSHYWFGEIARLNTQHGIGG
jgi:hypothetical protein